MSLLLGDFTGVYVNHHRVGECVVKISKPQEPVYIFHYIWSWSFSGCFSVSRKDLLKDAFQGGHVIESRQRTILLSRILWILTRTESFTQRIFQGFQSGSLAFLQGGIFSIMYTWESVRGNLVSMTVYRAHKTKLWSKINKKNIRVGHDFTVGKRTYGIQGICRKNRGCSYRGKMWVDIK